MFLHVQNTQTLKVYNFYFIQMFFFPIKCALFFLEIENDSNIDD
jgi:hypothetical protein